MTAIPVVRHQRAAIDRQQAIAGIFVMLGLVDIFVFGFLADKGDAVFTFTLTGAAVSVPNLNLHPVLSQRGWALSRSSSGCYMPVSS